MKRQYKGPEREKQREKKWADRKGGPVKGKDDKPKTGYAAKTGSAPASRTAKPWAKAGPRKFSDSPREGKTEYPFKSRNDDRPSNGAKKSSPYGAPKAGRPGAAGASRGRSPRAEYPPRPQTGFEAPKPRAYKPEYHSEPSMEAPRKKEWQGANPRTRSDSTSPRPRAYKPEFRSDSSMEAPRKKEWQNSNPRTGSAAPAPRPRAYTPEYRSESSVEAPRKKEWQNSSPRTPNQAPRGRGDRKDFRSTSTVEVHLEPDEAFNPKLSKGERDGWFIEETKDRKALASNDWQDADWDDDDDDDEEEEKKAPENQMVYGRNPVMEAVKSKKSLNKVYIQKEISGEYFKKLMAALRLRDIPFTMVDKVALDRLTNRGVHQGVAAMGSIHPYMTFDRLLKKLGKLANPMVLVLAQVYDPHNLGSLLRSAEGAGVQGVIIPRRDSCGLTPVVAKVSAGGIEYVPVCRVNNIANALDQMREEGYRILGVEAMGDSDYNKVDYRGMTAILMGGEDKGLTPNLLKKCDNVVKIKMAGKLSSLNLSVAGAVVLFEALKQRGVTPLPETKA